MRFVASTVLLALLVSDCCTAASLEGLNPSSGEEADNYDEFLEEFAEDVMVGCDCDFGSTRQGNSNCGCGNNGGYNMGYYQQLPPINDLTGEQHAKIVDMHNRARSFIAAGKMEGQPPAQNMKELDWNEQLAWRAQNWANTCSIEDHDPDNKFVGEFKFGQNMGWRSIMMNNADNVTEITNDFLINATFDWYKEVEDYGFQPIQETQRDAFNRPIGPMTLHYTQGVWANTKSIGCGLNTCQHNGRTGLFLVCNYYPAGNYIGQFPYINGNTDCENFNMGPSRYDNLCREYN